MPGDRSALLIATGTYEDATLGSLRSPAQDSHGLAAVLSDPEVGGFQVETMLEAPAHQLTRTIERFFRNRNREDLLLLHLSCHGIKDDDGQLYFAACDTDKDLLASTAVPAGFLRSQIERCRARSIVLLLDCCYSGAYLAGTKGDDSVHVEEELNGHGRAVLTATNRTEYAWEGDTMARSAAQPSRFTGAVIEGLRSGAADHDCDGRITVTELYKYVYETVRREDSRQTPQMWADLEYQVVIARVPSPRATALRDQRRRPRVERVRRGDDTVVALSYDLREAVFGTVKEIAVHTAVLCGTCAGAGARPGTSEQVCASCAGSGESTGEPGRVGEACLSCGATGVVFPDPCPECLGDGRVRARRTLTARIPAGAFRGTRILLAGEGEVGPGGGPAADLFLELYEKPHPVFSRSGDDLCVTLTVSQSLADQGGIVMIETFDGVKPVQVRPGAVSEMAIPLQDLGVPRLREGGRGNLIVLLEVAN